MVQNIISQTFLHCIKLIGNEYGGEPKQAITITAGGSGYDTNDTIVFDSPPGYDATNPGALQIIEANLTVINGAVTAIVVTKLGFGYDPTNPPGFTINGVGSGTGLTLEYNFSASGPKRFLQQIYLIIGVIPILEHLKFLI